MDDLTQSVDEWTGPDLPDGPVSEEIAALMMRRLASLSRKIGRREATAAAVLDAERARALFTELEFTRLLRDAGYGDPVEVAS